MASRGPRSRGAEPGQPGAGAGGASAPPAPKPELPEPERIRQVILAALERRRRTRSQLETVLRRKGFAAPACAPILDRLTEVGLIDDLEYARVYLRRRVAGKPRGARLLRAELLGKGVPGAEADRALAEFAAEAGDPAEDALRALGPLLKRNATLEPRLLRQKAWQFLARRGFAGDVVERALREALRGAGEDEGE